MAVSPNSLYQGLGQGLFDFSSDTLKLALFTSSMTGFNIDTDSLGYAALGGECPATGNYVSGGFSLTGVTWTTDDATDTVTLTASTLVVPDLTIADYRYLVIYDDTSVGKLVIAREDLGATQSVTATEVSFSFPNGIFSLSTAP